LNETTFLILCYFCCKLLLLLVVLAGLAGLAVCVVMEVGRCKTSVSNVQRNFAGFLRIVVALL